MDLFREFYDQCSFAKSLNSTFLVLIPKKGGAEDLGDFRPISLLGGLYKLLAKVLVNRLKKVLDKHKRNEKGLICKLDIEKAYDSINWNFLMKVLVKMGFGLRWMEWIWWCISTAKFSVMINGVPVGFFSNSKGLRQGDPFSSYFFVLGMEVLSNLIRRAVDGGFLSGCRIRGRGEEEMIVSHLLFADDTIIFYEARKEQLGIAAHCLLGVAPWSSPQNCLYLRWGGRENEEKISPVEKTIYFKGRTYHLIKSTMASLPIYNMSLFRMPKSVANRLEKLQRDFLWGGGSLERKVHLIKWEVVCTQKKKGDLGIRKIDPLNKALLGKWLWRFAVEKDNLWKLVIGVKYGQEEFGWRTKEARGTYGVGVWKEILKEAKWCWDNIKFKLFELAVHRNATVNEKWDPSSGHGGTSGYLQRRTLCFGKGGGGVHRKYGVKAAYNGLAVINACAFPSKCVWVDKVPTKAVFFAWEAAWGKILTLDRL
ncbi:putative ribonuclease H protein [Vitis vinifera]|uniref:Putative ribonuclease H protein n=1 Tax=Vitis vinifera TaxID=29760 RepID=A0A438IUW0_VITVI|nr:putative ribonuclease H protein [Vitis vinifera]